MEVNVIKKSKELVGIEWSCPEKGFGVLVIQYNRKGGFDINAEYIDLSTVAEILSVAKNDL